MIIIPRFCPGCAAPLARRRQRPHEPARLSCASCGFVHYDNPAPAAAVIVENDRGQVLLGLRAGRVRRGWWDIIGGFIEGREAPEVAAVREVLEEAGVEVCIERLLGVWSDRYGATREKTLNVVYVGRIVAGEPKAGDDVQEVRWFDAADLPLDRIAFRCGRLALEKWAGERRQPRRLAR